MTSSQPETLEIRGRDGTVYKWVEPDSWTITKAYATGEEPDTFKQNRRFVGASLAAPNGDMVCDALDDEALEALLRNIPMREFARVLDRTLAYMAEVGEQIRDLAGNLEEGTATNGSSSSPKSPEPSTPNP